MWIEENLIYAHICVNVYINIYMIYRYICKMYIVHTHTRAHVKSDTQKCKACVCISCAEKPFHHKFVLCGMKKT